LNDFNAGLNRNTGRDKAQMCQPPGNNPAALQRPIPESYPAALMWGDGFSDHFSKV